MARCFLVGCRLNRYLDTFRYVNYNIKLRCLIILSAFFFLEETGFPRDKASKPLPQRPNSFMANRIATFLPGTAVVHRPAVANIVGPPAKS